MWDNENQSHDDGRKLKKKTLNLKNPKQLILF